MSQKPRILIVEDDADQRLIIREVLRQHFPGGAISEAASRAEAGRFEPDELDLVLCDYNLPDGTAEDVMSDLHARGDVTFVVVTGDNCGDTAASMIRAGASDYVVKLGGYTSAIPLAVEKNLEVARLRREHKSTLQEVEEKNEQLQRLTSELAEAAATDVLTGLYNRRQLERIQTEMFDRAYRYGEQLACVMLDMDGFKKLNDTHGHAAGDAVLVAMGAALQSQMRRADVAARYGGDEFVLLLPHTDEQDAMMAVDRLREGLTCRLPRVNVNGAMVLAPVTISAGVASVSASGASSGAELVAAADKALYAAKVGGRNRTVCMSMHRPPLTPVRQAV